MDEQVNKLAVNQVKREITPKNRLFLSLLTSGKSTLEAYKEAGYKGNDHAAYQLRSDLKEELIKVLEGQGIDRAGLMLSLKQLIDQPTLEEVNGKVLLKHKLAALNLLFKMVESQTPDKTDRPKITAFIVNNKLSTNQPSEVIDVTHSSQE
jgi:hypothetical protein